MKKAIWILVLLIATGDIAFGQKQMFAGKVTDEHGMPVPGARIKINKGYDLKYETQADKDGLYYTQLLPQDSYNMEVIANGRYMRARRIPLHANGHEKWFYNLKIGAKKVTVERTDKDPFMGTKLSSIANDDKERMLSPWDRGTTRIDKAGKVISSKPEAPGRMK
ncbi:MAG: Carboxypeptidase regulatory-like domain [Flavipsychrobacter sp.]|nr:Carboxypeptidase regulatory-like domain [Flavipsychrobacter sp.]